MVLDALRCMNNTDYEKIKKRVNDNIVLDVCISMCIICQIYIYINEPAVQNLYKTYKLM